MVGVGCKRSQWIKMFKTVFSFLILGVLSSVHPLIIRGGGEIQLQIKQENCEMKLKC